MINSNSIRYSEYSIRSIIFFVDSLVTIIFRRELNNFKNRLLIRLSFKSKVKNEIKNYYQLAIAFIIISVNKK